MSTPGNQDPRQQMTPEQHAEQERRAAEAAERRRQWEAQQAAAQQQGGYGYPQQEQQQQQQQQLTPEQHAENERRAAEAAERRRQWEAQQAAAQQQPTPEAGGYGYPQQQPAPEAGGYGYPQQQQPTPEAGGYGYPQQQQQQPVPDQSGYGYPQPTPEQAAQQQAAQQQAAQQQAAAEQAAQQQAAAQQQQAAQQQAAQQQAAAAQHAEEQRQLRLRYQEEQRRAEEAEARRREWEDQQRQQQLAQQQQLAAQQQAAAQQQYAGAQPDQQPQDPSQGVVGGIAQVPQQAAAPAATGTTMTYAPAPEVGSGRPTHRALPEEPEDDDFAEFEDEFSTPGYGLRGPRRRRHVMSKKSLGSLGVSVGDDGVVIGVDPQGNPAVLDVLRPKPREIVVVGSMWTAQIIALRTAAIGARIAVESVRPAAWAPMAQAAGGGLQCVSVYEPRQMAAQGASVASPVLVVRDLGAQPGRSQIAPTPWQSTLTVVPFLGPRAPRLLARADVIGLQNLSPQEAEAIGRVLRLPEQLTQTLPTLSDATMLWIAGDKRQFVMVQPTEPETGLLGGPRRMD
ncbi:hypothetical protein ACOKM3_13580 [Streptomyces sp. BH106]|uniref:hypothetical protein n=1 Tax=Streptomyces sp. BH106 TaxID=3410409 RepID=UPI003CE81441